MTHIGLNDQTDNGVNAKKKRKKKIVQGEEIIESIKSKTVTIYSEKQNFAIKRCKEKFKIPRIPDQSKKGHLNK